MLLELDEFERGYPRLTLSLFLDVVGFCKAAVTKSSFVPFNAALRDAGGDDDAQGPSQSEGDARQRQFVGQGAEPVCGG